MFILGEWFPANMMLGDTKMTMQTLALTYVRMPFASMRIGVGLELYVRKVRNERRHAVVLLIKLSLLFAIFTVF